MVRKRFVALRRLLGDESGNAMIEAALVIPVVLVMVFGVVATGRVVAAQIAVQSVVREASRTLAVAPSLQEGLPAAQARRWPSPAGRDSRRAACNSRSIREHSREAAPCARRRAIR